MELEQQFIHITNLIIEAKKRAYQAVNNELVSLYWQVGEYVSQQAASKAWGKSVVQELSNFIQTSEPNIIGFSSQNIWRMKQFYETYKDAPKLATVWREISWSHHKIIMPCRSHEEREFYIRLSAKEKWGVRELQRQINSSYFERVMIGNEKLATLGRDLPQDAINSFKDSYVLELLHLPEPHLEKDLRKAIAQNITKFLLEFGRD